MLQLAVVAFALAAWPAQALLVPAIFEGTAVRVGVFFGIPGVAPLLCPAEDFEPIEGTVTLAYPGVEAVWAFTGNSPEGPCLSAHACTLGSTYSGICETLSTLDWSFEKLSNGSYHWQASIWYNPQGEDFDGYLLPVGFA